MTQTKLHLALFAEGQAERVPPSEFRIFTAGVVSTTKGVFLFDDRAAVAVMAAYQEHGADIPVDYDHMMLDPYAPMGGGKAAGWLKLELRMGELWAVDVKWTPAGDRALRDAEYRYISPAFYTDDEGRMSRLINVALTNLPATHGLEPLVAASETTAPSAQRSTPMKQVLVALGLSESASEADALVALSKDRDAVKDVLSLTGATSLSAALGILAGFKEEAGKTKVLSARVVELETGLRKKEVERIVGEKVTAGYLTPANREFAIKLGMKDPESFDAYLATLTSQVVVDTSGGKDKPAKATAKVSLSRDEKQIAERFGMSPKEFSLKCLSDSGDVPADEAEDDESDKEVALCLLRPSSAKRRRWGPCGPRTTTRCP